MFIGWLKPAQVNTLVEIAHESGRICDGYFFKLLLSHAPHLCYGAYDEEELIGAILATVSAKRITISGFFVKESYQRQGIGKRLLKTLVTSGSLSHQTIDIRAPLALKSFFEGYDFLPQCEVVRFVNGEKIPPLAFSHERVKELESSPFEKIAKMIDRKTYHDDRGEIFFEQMQRTSSLKFALSCGFQHSSVIDSKEVYLGPWEVESTSKEEARKLLEGVLYYRGMKKIVADIPLSNTYAMQLLTEYHFEEKERFLHMVRGEVLPLAYENIFSFSL